MKRIIFITTAFITAIPLSASATIINVPDDYVTIQEGIDASSDGDTVLVQPGMYVENINFNGHNIILGSLYLTTEDASYISSTIIDGDDFGNVVVFENGEDSTAVITGFTIQNGYSYEQGGGIYCSQSNPAIIRNSIIQNTVEYEGGGILCEDASPLISGNYIARNRAVGWEPGEPWDYPVGTGGGIYCRYSDPEIINNVIVDNWVSAAAGGLFCYRSNPVIRNNTVSRNDVEAEYDGGNGIFCDDSNPVVSNTILWGNMGSEVYADSSSFPVFSYCDIRGGWDGEGNIDVNPFIVDPENEDFNICAQSPCINAGDPNITDPDGTRSDIGAFFPDHPECEMGNTWFVSMSGDDDSGDGSPGNPFRTIQHGIDIAFHRDTIIVENGVYVESINCFESIVLASNYIFTQDTLDIQNTMIDGDSGPVITMISCDSLSSIIGLTIRNGSGYFGHGINCNHSDPAISYNTITDNSAFGIFGFRCGPSISNNTIMRNSGSGITCRNSNIFNNVITDNSGAGIECKGPDVTIVNNIIGGNSASGINCSGSNPLIESNTISFNHSGIYCQNGSNPLVTNTIAWGNMTYEIHAHGDENNPVITYSDIGGGWEGEGNIDADPLLLDPLNGNYNICAGSPCIDAGDPNINDPDGTRSDIGLFFPEHPECVSGNKWYVSVDGDDDTGDGSYGNPFRTIQYGIDVSFHGDTVIVENGTYVENITCAKNIVLASNYIFTGDTLDIQNTIIDGDSVATAVVFVGCDSLTLITGITITNGTSPEDGAGIECRYSELKIESNIIKENAGSGIFCYYSNPSIVGNNIRDNSRRSYYNGGIRCDHSDPLISHNIISDNSFGGISCEYSSPTIIFNTISGNSLVENNTRGGGILSARGSPIIQNNLISGNSCDQTGGGIYYYDYDATAVISNNVICYNSAQEGGGLYCLTEIDFKNNIVFGNSGGGLNVSGATIVNSIIRSNTPYEIEGTASVAYCNVEGGWNGSGNIDVDPLFRDAENGDFHLMAVECGDNSDSPCIDAGFVLYNDSLLNCSFGLGTDRSDMGAFGGGDSVQVGIENHMESPINFSLSPNYPNPFNASTSIRIALPEPGDVRLVVYDLLGRQVEALLDDYRPAGMHRVVFDASDYSSGIYFYRVQAGDLVETKRMLLLK